MAETGGRKGQPGERRRVGAEWSETASGGEEGCVGEEQMRVSGPRY